jgi:hypothetical protein
MATRTELETIAAQASAAAPHTPEAKAELRALAERQQQREAEDFEAFAAVDRAAHKERVAAAVGRAEGDLEATRDAEAEAEDKVAGAIQAERAAQDRHREHAEYARKQQEAWKRVQGRSGPREQADALRDAQNAELVAQGEQAAAEGKTAARELAERDLEAARARTAALEETLRVTRDVASYRGRPLYSAETCTHNLMHMLRIWDSLQLLEQQMVRQGILNLAMLTGVADDLKMKGAAEREAELEGKRPQPGAFTLPGLSAGIGGRQAHGPGAASTSPASFPRG